RENINDMLGNIVLDAAMDDTFIGYNVARFFDAFFNLNPEYFNEIGNNYDLILADIVTSSYYKDIITEAAVTQGMDDVSNILTQVIEYVFDHLDEMAKQANMDKDTFQKEWYEIARKLDKMKLTDDPRAYGTLFDECATSVGKYIDASKQADLLSKFSGLKGEVLSASVNAVISGGLDTAADVIKYASCYNAYKNATDTFKKVLIMIYYYAMTNIEVGGADQKVYCAFLMDAIERFLNNSSEENLNFGSIALRFAKQSAENFAGSFAEEFIDLLADQIPVIKGMNMVRKAAGLATSATLFLVDRMTSIDDISYSAAMTYNMYYLTNCAAYAADTFGDAIKSSSDQFTAAYEFDEAVRSWRTCALMLCDFGMEFETRKLQRDQKTILLPPSMRDASWRSTAISMVALQKV
ncbi:MAG: hypothetical protein IKG55_02215, partial [Solobacterium sp.]|nr:hypothetical protein [Solobacterium sp.]